MKPPTIPKAPPAFSGTLGEFYDRWAKHVLVPPRAVEEFHSQFRYYLESEDPVFLVRQVRGQERGEDLRTDEGSLLRPTDNAPAWWIHYQLFTGAFRRFDSFAEFVEAIPCHMFRVRLLESVNSAGWHVAHIFDVKDRGVEFRRWGREELARRAARSIHPCNYFYVPKVDWQRHGSDPTVVAFFYDKFRSLYGAVWDDFMELVAGARLAVPPDAEGYPYSYPATPADRPEPTVHPGASAVTPAGTDQSDASSVDESLPPPGLSHLARRVPDSEALGFRRDWTGNDGTNRNHYGAIGLAESPLRIRLSWKKSPRGTARPVGVFDLDLRRLLEAGYVMLLPRSQDQIRLRFYHGGDGIIYIQTKNNEPALPVGRVG